MICNRALATLQKAQLKGSGHKELRVLIPGVGEYAIHSIADFPDNIIIEVVPCKTAEKSNS